MVGLSGAYNRYRLLLKNKNKVYDLCIFLKSNGSGGILTGLF